MRSIWAVSAFDGEGARQAGGRWNHKGDAVVYAAESLALAAVELLVHLDPEDAPDDLVAVRADIPDTLDVREVRLDELPAHWRSVPAPPELQDLGSAWLRSKIRSKKSAVLRVPSAVIARESCYLINPAHPQAAAISIGAPEAFHFDPRLWKA